MIQKKICLIGVPAVGKTSLVRRFVEGIYSADYLTTIGVKIDRKTVNLEDGEVTLIVWDIAGDDAFTPLRISYVRGASALLLVADGTRSSTVDRAIGLHERLQSELGPLPAVLAINKRDLTNDWIIDASRHQSLNALGINVVETSALDGLGVEQAFEQTARATLEKTHE